MNPTEQQQFESIVSPLRAEFSADKVKIIELNERLNRDFEQGQLEMALHSQERALARAARFQGYAERLYGPDHEALGVRRMLGNAALRFSLRQESAAAKYGHEAERWIAQILYHRDGDC